MPKCGCRTAEAMEREVYESLNAIREEYRQKMNAAGNRAQCAAAIDDMAEASVASTESERYREAFHAMNRAIDTASKVLS